MCRLTPYLLLITGLLFASCKNNDTLFTSLSPDDTGIRFANRITENDTMNILAFEYVYNGGGVALGDFNNDSLTDVYFTGNTTSNKLYLNKGDFKFEDITDKAGVSADKRWSSGVALIDINNDGLLDIYVCATAKKGAQERANMLYVNQGAGTDGVPVFKDMAREYGVADTSHTTTAAFFDYDNDGDADLFLVVNEMDDRNFPNKYHEKIRDGSSKRTDRLYRNDWDEALGHPVFTNVSKEAGILIEGYGLGVNITDINQDGWKDIYVTNDYLTNDLLYINNGNGTFTDQAAAYFKHTSHSAMGNDISDINNDGLVDVIALDMMPATNYRKKMMTPAGSYVTYQNNERFGYQHQYARNTLQLNQGIDPTSGHPVFSDISLLSGVAETDWSWAPMVTDFDNDGKRDMIVTNGFPRDITDLDFIAYRGEVSSLMSRMEMLQYIPSVKLKNFAFHNKGNLQFEDVTDQWGIKEPSFSNGAAYADLDNDGDLDYIVNNINDSASVYRNNLVQQKPEESNYLRVKLNGSKTNPMGLGAWIEIQYQGGQKQVYDHTPYRGYLSTVEQVAHFGLGKVQQVDQLKIVWQGGKTQILKNVKANQVLTLDEKNATMDTNQSIAAGTSPPALFNDITNTLNVGYKHEEMDVIDFNVQKLLPHKLSQFGPALAVGDVNGDGLDDIFVGGSYQHKGRFMIQNTAGQFAVKDLLPGTDGIEKISEDMGVLLFDVENDGDLDLYIVSGSYEHQANSPALLDRLYLNDGKGNFQLANQALPQFMSSGSCVKAADFDRDGDLDLFVGGRLEPGAYPKPVSSYILRNDSSKGQVKFTDVTSQVAQNLNGIGLICDALWTDYDNDGWVDLLLAGEWMPLTFLKNTNGKLQPATSGLESYKGWWNSLTAGDFDNDGDIDYIAGNLGTNTLNRASDRQPISMYAKDFNNDGFFDAIPTVYYKAQDDTYKEFTYNTRDELGKQIIQARQRFQEYAKFSQATINDILKPEELKDALVLRANWMKSSYLENQGNGTFKITELPIQAQVAPLYGMVAEDVDQDGNLDVVLTGNNYGSETVVGRYDAFYGLVLKGDGKGNFQPLLPQQSGFCVRGDAKGAVRLANAKGQLMITASQNRDQLKFFTGSQPVKRITLAPQETTALLRLKNGQTRREEIGYGSSFLSQSSHSLLLSKDVVSVEVIDQKGNKRKVDL
ncbi:VCBS repeat-containing protein [Telluribacter sp. SYSU D00476]|uniref:VCBS repeat-containing protein n=1 Tax=Telluribacter sp. SYSU D00476 TaxID=2811430 RepID=UPI001FF4BB2D|nr:VCBS repeat-containing protein [Telluribacter sp. SYSU D00476]